MTMIQYLNAFRVFGADVLLLSLGVSAITSLLKKTVFKSLPNKAYVFLPFAVGVIVYAAYRALLTMSATPFTDEFASTLEGGFACGCAATLYYVVYEQFVRGGQTVADMPPVGEFLKELVPDEKLKRAAEELTAHCGEKSAEELFPYVTEVLRRYAGADCSDAEIMLRADLITKFFSQKA